MTTFVRNNRTYFLHERRFFIDSNTVDRANLRVGSIPPEATIPLYNSNQPDVESNPDVPIGSVVCTFYNLMHNADVKKTRSSYPFIIFLESKKQARMMGGLEKYDNKVLPPFDGLSLSKRLIIQHKFQVTGTVKGFERRILRGVSLKCVDFDVSDLTIIESKKAHEKHYDEE